MPRNSSGTYTLPEPDFSPGTTISSSVVNTDFNDIGDTLTDSLSRTGQGGMQAALSLANLGVFYGTDPDTGLRRTAANTQALSVGGSDWTFTQTDLTDPNGNSVGPMIGEMRMWMGPNAPTGWLLLIGQACTSSYPLQRAFLIAAGSPYGMSGSDPLFPNMQCVVPVGQDTQSRGLLTGSNILGALLGTQSVTLGTSNLPAYTPSGSVSTPTITSTVAPSGSFVGTTTFNNPGGGGGGTGINAVSTHSVSSTSSQPAFTGTAQGGSSTPFSVVQPTIVINFIARAA